MHTRIQITDDKFRAQLAEIPGSAGRWASQLASRTAVKLKETAPAASGQMARSIRSYSTGSDSAEVLVDANYSIWAHDGRGPGGVDVGAVVDWAERKGLGTGAGFAIARHISMFGTKENPWVDTFLDSNEFEDLSDTVAAMEIARVTSLA